jgi:hypothetical protein
MNQPLPLKISHPLWHGAASANTSSRRHLSSESIHELYALYHSFLKFRNKIDRFIPALHTKSPNHIVSNPFNELLKRYGSSIRPSHVLHFVYISSDKKG